MKILSTLRKVIAGLVIVLLMPGSAYADFTGKLRANFERFDPMAPGGSGHTVLIECGGAFDGSDYANQRPATARLFTFQKGNMSRVRIVLKHGKPNTLYTVWLRLKGIDQDGNSYGGSPLSFGGATPLAPGSDLDQLTADWIGAGSTTPANGFMTDSNGKGVFRAVLDFPLYGGRYPFNEISAAALNDIRISKFAAALATPTAIVDPGDDGVDGPYMIRVLSHCQDGMGHGLSPGVREAWFDFP